MPNPHAPENGHGEALPLAITDLRLDGAGEPRVLDLDVAERLGLASRDSIRKLIRQNADELRRYGDLVEVEGVKWNLRHGTANSPRGAANSLPGEANSRGRPGRAYLLNHDQAMIVAVLSRAPRAADVRQQLVQVYNAYRATRAAPVQNPVPSADVESVWRFIEGMVRMHTGLRERVDGIEDRQRIAAAALAARPAKGHGPRRSRADYDHGIAGIDALGEFCKVLTPMSGSRLLHEHAYRAWDISSPRLRWGGRMSLSHFVLYGETMDLRSGFTEAGPCFLDVTFGMELRTIVPGQAANELFSLAAQGGRPA